MKKKITHVFAIPDVCEIDGQVWTAVEQRRIYTYVAFCASNLETPHEGSKMNFNTPAMLKSSAQ